MSATHLTIEELLAYHGEVMREHGQESTVLSFETLEAAITRPQTRVFGDDAFPTLATKAGALLQAIVIGHPFLGGNKRAGLGAVLAFLELNGVDPSVADDDALYDLVIAVATGELREVADIAGRLAALWAPHLRAT